MKTPREQIAEQLSLTVSILSDPNKADEIRQALKALPEAPTNDYVAYLETYLLEILAINRSLFVKNKNLTDQINNTGCARQHDCDSLPYHEDER